VHSASSPAAPLRIALLLVAPLLLTALVLRPAHADDAPPAVAAKPPTEEQLRFFENKIRPLFANHCYQCHGPDKQRGNLRLDSLAAIKEGGDLGSALTLDKPEESLLLQAVNYADDALKMPPAGKLTDQQIADLTAWVKAGAPYPPEAATKTPAGTTPQPAAEVKLWAFDPLQDPPVPAVKNAAWPANPLDHFILARLEAQGLQPAPPADKRTWLRRVTYDLTGLPPTAAELRAFLADDSADAYATVVDRLLASPHYGERWARHWLDIVRYADSNGLDENVAFGNAWRYRDYVVAAFNRDKPYDQFLREQLAGDLLPVDANDPHAEAIRHERLIATGLLALGAKVLAEVDPVKMEMDIIDEQVDTLGRALLGLTFGCARCHDHKFDPVSTEDYYAVAGIFKSTRTMEHFKKVARWYENDLSTAADRALKAAHNERVAAQNTALEAFIKQANDALLATKPGAELPKNPEAEYPEETKAELKKLRDELAALKKAAPVAPSAMGASEGTVADLAVHIRGNHLTLGKVVPRGLPRVLAASMSVPPALETAGSGRLEFADWLVSPQHPLTARVFVNRVWRWHFGEGLVKSTDNFGKLGDAPSHPELLDWLARRFMQQGWSIKDLHRLMVLSSTYRMSNRHDPQAFAADPENRLLWRMETRRLEAEEIRDALLAVSGALDRTMGGSLLHVDNRAYLFDHTSKDNTKYDSPRRSLYLPLIRNNVYDVFQLFDAPDATVLNGDRAATTIAPQALFMLNSDLVADSSERLAKHLLAAEPDDTHRLQALYEQAYSRAPTPAELERDRALLARFEQALADKPPESRPQQAWSWLCHIVLAANEFIYLN